MASFDEFTNDYLNRKKSNNKNSSTSVGKSSSKKKKSFDDFTNEYLSNPNIKKSNTDYGVQKYNQLVSAYKSFSDASSNDNDWHEQSYYSGRTQQLSNLEKQKKQLADYFKNNSAKYSADFLNEMNSNLEKLSETNASLLKSVASSSEFYSQWDNRDAYNRDYDNYTYSNKYKGVSYDDLMKENTALTQKLESASNEEKSTLERELNWINTHKYDKQFADTMSAETLQEIQNKYKENEKKKGDYIALQKSLGDAQQMDGTGDTLTNLIDLINDDWAETADEKKQSAIDTYSKQIAELGYDDSISNVLYYDENGTAVTAEQLLEIKRSESDVAKINSNSDSKALYENIVALEQEYKTVSELLEIINNKNNSNKGFLPDEITKLQAIGIDTSGNYDTVVQNLYSRAMNIQNSLDTDIVSLNELGYDYDKLRNYNDWKTSRDNYSNEVAEYQNIAEEHPVLATLESVINTPQVIGEFAGNMINSIGNDSSLVNVYDDEHTNKGQVYQNTVANLIEDAVYKKTDSEVASWLASTAYSGITSAAQSALIGATFSLVLGPAAGEVIALGVMGTQAAANSYNSAIKNGSTNGEAVTYAVASGIGEALFEKIPLDNLFRLGKGAAKETLFSVIKTIAKQSAIEGLEEGGTELWNTLADAIINGDHSAYNTSVRQYELQGYSAEEAEKLATTDWINELLSSMVGGAFGGLSTGGVAGTGYVAGVAQRNQDLKNTGRLVSATGGVNELLSSAKGLEDLSKRETKTINKLTNKIEGKTTEKGVSSRYARNVGKLYNFVSEKQTENVRKSITEELKANNADTSAETINVVLKYAQGEELTSIEQEIFDTNNGIDVLDNVVYKMAQKSAVTTTETVDRVNADTFEGVTENTAENDFKQTTYNGEAISFKYKSPDTVELDNGETVSVEDITMSDDDAVFYDAVMGENDIFPEARFVNGELTNGVDITTANEIRKIFGGTPTAAQLKGVEMYYRYGMYNIKRFGESGALTEVQEKQVFNLGRAFGEYLAETESKTPKVKKYSKGKVKYNIKSKLNSRQQASVEVVEKLADMFNITFNLFESSVNANGERVSIMPDGKETTANGYYMNGEIYIDINAGNKGQGAMLYTAAHELTHYIKEWSPKKFNALADFLVEQYQSKGRNVEYYVNMQMEKARKAGNKNMRYSEAFEEFVADSMEKMLTDANAVEKLTALRVKDKSIFDKLREGIKKLVEKIKQEYAKLTPDSAEGRIVATMTDVFSDIQDLFLEALDDASNNFQNAEKNTAANDGAKMQLREMGLEEFSKQTLNTIKLRNGILIETISDLEAHIKKALTTKEKHNMYFGAISENVKKKIENDVNSNIFKEKQYAFVISYDDIIHIAEHFGVDASVISKEIIKLYDIVKNYDKVSLDTTDKGTKKLVFDKSYSNADYRSVEIASNKKASLDLVTLFITKNNIKRGTQSVPPATKSGSQRGSNSSNNSVSQEASTVNNNYMQKEPTKFSLRENVEETKNLIAVHNLSAEKLLKSLNLGGLPMPSIAIMKAKDGHTQFGDISLVFRKDTIDPKTDKANKVYGGDAWTPTYPKTEYKVNEKAAGDIYHRARVAGQSTFFNPVYLHPDNIVDDVNSRGGIDGVINHFKDDYGMKQFYLAETSEAVKMIMGEKKNELSAQEIEQFDFIISEFGKEKILKIGTEGYSGRNWMQEYGDEYKTALAKYYKSIAITDITDEQINEIIESEKPNQYALDVKKIKNYIENGPTVTETIADLKATQKEIDNRVNQDEFIAWLNELFNGLVEKSGIRNNVDFYTSSGNRRSFEATHYVENLENVVKVMKSQQEVGNSFLFSGLGIWGVAAKRYNSIDEIKADSNRLVEWNEDLFSEVRRGIGGKLTDIADTIKSTTESNPFIARDTAIDCILETIATAKTRSGMLRNLKSYYALNQEMVNESLVQDIIDLVAEVQAMPTDYFEAKPQRAVHFDEVAGVIMPTQESYGEDLTEIKAKLSEYGIPVVEYTFGSNDDRIQALNSLEGVKFSERGQSVYELLGENKRLQKENNRLKEKNKYLNELVKLQRKITHGKIIDRRSTETQAKKIIKSTGSKIELSNLADQLYAFYTFIIGSDELVWDNVMTRASWIADDIIKEIPQKVQRDEYAEEILSYLRSTNIRLNNVQRAEVENIYDSYNAYRKRLMGSITISQNGTSLDSVWQGLAEQFPETFSKDTNPADMPLELADIISSLRDSREIIEEFDNAEQMRYIAEQIYDSYWDVSTVESVMDKMSREHRLQISELKEQHAERVEEIRKRHDKEIQDQKAYYRDMVNRVRQRSALSHKKQMLAYQDKVHEAQAKAIEKRNNTVTRNQILKTLDKIDARLTHPTKEKI